MPSLGDELSDTRFNFVCGWPGIGGIKMTAEARVVNGGNEWPDRTCTLHEHEYGSGNVESVGAAAIPKLKPN
jgi:hypothetical protein